MSVKIWKIKNTDEDNIKILNYIKKINHKHMLLDLTKTKFNCLEKFVYETALFHFKRLGLIVDPKTNHVEFWYKDKFDTHKLHMNSDESENTTNNYIYPLQTCVSYFSKSDYPTIITNIDIESYTYKDFASQTEIFLSFPELNKQITFDGKFFHGSTTLSENNVFQDRHIIVIILWNIKPNNVEYYKSDDETEDTPFIISIEEDEHIDKIMIPNNMINSQLFENLLYKCDKTTMYEFNKLITPNISSYRFINTPSVLTPSVLTPSVLTPSVFKEKQVTRNMLDDIKEIMNLELKHNRFMQRFKYTKIYTPDMCVYIINESEKYATNNGGWTTMRHKNYPTTDLQLDKIPSLVGLVFGTLNTIISKIQESYGLNEEILFDIKDLFVVKYKHDEQNHLEIHRDTSFISFNILLSNLSDFGGGGTYFEDGITTHLEQGDILIHSGQTKHAGQRITKGVRYILVGFLDIKVKNEPKTETETESSFCALNYE